MSTIWEKDKLSQRQLDRIDRIRSTRKKKSKARRSSLIMSVAIFGHGCEDYSKPLKPVQFGQHVYSRSCMPGTVSIGNKYRVRGMLDDIRRQFSADTDTLSILEGYAVTAKDEYQKVLNETASLEGASSMGKGAASLDKGAASLDKGAASLGKGAASLGKGAASLGSGMSSFLFDKTFGFYDREPGENIKTIDKMLYEGIGIHVVDIREKIIEADGSVHYRRLFSPSERMDISNFNLIYKDGVKHVLKDVLGKDSKKAVAALGFGRKNRIMELSLERLYDFFLLLGVDYVNIMDYTCRSCAVPMPPAVLENIYRVEQERSRSNPDRFGGSKKRGWRKTKRRG